MGATAFYGLLTPFGGGHARPPEIRPGSPPAPAPAPGLAKAPGQDSLNANANALVREAYEAMVYRAESRQVAFSGQYQQSAAGGTDLSARQLTFDFFAESRVEELALFRERTASTAEGLDGVQRETYLEASRRVASRFEASLNISGAALNGFADGTEGAANAEEVFNKLVEFALQLLDASEGLFEEVFSFFGASPADSTQFDVDALLNQFLGNLGGLFGGAGGAQASSFNVQLEFSFSFEAEITVKEAEVQQSDPILLDLDGDGFELTSHRAGARFDILGNGQQQTTAFVTGGDAFLAIDRNGNGRIDSGKELFGDQHGAANGYEELRKLDTNEDGVIDRRDADFGKLLLFRDNGNGITEPGELLTLEEAGIASISLGYTNVKQYAAGGNRITQIASFTRTDGTLGRAGDALLNYTI